MALKPVKKGKLQNMLMSIMIINFGEEYQQELNNLNLADDKIGQKHITEFTQLLNALDFAFLKRYFFFH